VDLIKALGSEKRLRVLEWLRDPVANLLAERDGDLVEDGVCGLFIAEKLNISQATLSEHMRVLVAAGLVKAKRAKGWTFYKRDEPGLKAARRLLSEAL